MSEFSLIQQLQLLSVDPYPTHKFHQSIKYLKHFEILIKQFDEETNDFALVKLFNDFKVNTLLTNVSIKPNLRKLIETLDIPTQITNILKVLLKLIVIKVKECDNDKAFEILSDFRTIKPFIFGFKQSTLFENSDLDCIVELFAKKLIQIFKEIEYPDYKEKFYICNVIKSIIIELGKHPTYAKPIISQLIQQLKTLQNIDSNFMHYFTFLTILREIIGKICCQIETQTTCGIFQDLHNFLTEKLAQKLSTEETYLIRHILRAIDLYFSMLQVKKTII